MITKEEIQTSINSRLQTAPTRIEGGTVQDIIGSVSFELSNILDTKIDTIIDNAFVSTANDFYLQIKGKELGIYKKQALASIVDVKITNASPNITVPIELQAKTKDGIIFQTIEETKTDSLGCANIKMQCQTKGLAGNVPVGALFEFNSVYAGYENAKITNEKEGYDGFEEETTEEYRQRILEYMKNNACNSNIQDYILWAKSVSGVKNVLVKDATMAGCGHVKVYISAANNELVSEELIQNTKTYIEKEQIVNAIVEVYPLNYMRINVSAVVRLKENGNLDYVRNKLQILLSEYLNTMPDVVSYLYISNLFFEIQDIGDVSNYLLNEDTASIVVDEYSVPIVGDISIEEGE